MRVGAGGKGVEGWNEEGERERRGGQKNGTLMLQSIDLCCDHQNSIRNNATQSLADVLWKPNGCTRVYVLTHFIQQCPCIGISGVQIGYILVC